jgi:hypothetical protein
VLVLWLVQTVREITRQSELRQRKIIRKSSLASTANAAEGMKFLRKYIFLRLFWRRLGLAVRDFAPMARPRVVLRASH